MRLPPLPDPDPALIEMADSRLTLSAQVESALALGVPFRVVRAHRETTGWLRRRTVCVIDEIEWCHPNVPAADEWRTMNIATIKLTEHPPATHFRSHSEFDLEVGTRVSEVDWELVAKTINDALPSGYKARVDVHVTGSPRAVPPPAEVLIPESLSRFKKEGH